MPMKTSSAAKRVSRTTARNCVLINQLATPGLGSLMAGRRLAGAGQLLLALAGFALLMGWFLRTTIASYQELVHGAEQKSAAWLGEAGALIFAVAWFWSLITSFQILGSARQDEPTDVPPRLH